MGVGRNIKELGIYAGEAAVRNFSVGNTARVIKDVVTDIDRNPANIIEVLKVSLNEVVEAVNTIQSKVNDLRINEVQNEFKDAIKTLEAVGSEGGLAKSLNLDGVISKAESVLSDLRDPNGPGFLSSAVGSFNKASDEVYSAASSIADTSDKLLNETLPALKALSQESSETLTGIRGVVDKANNIMDKVKLAGVITGSILGAAGLAGLGYFISAIVKEGRHRKVVCERLKSLMAAIPKDWITSAVGRICSADEMNKPNKFFRIRDTRNNMTKWHTVGLLVLKNGYVIIGSMIEERWSGLRAVSRGMMDDQTKYGDIGLGVYNEDGYLVDDAMLKYNVSVREFGRVLKRLAKDNASFEDIDYNPDADNLLRQQTYEMKYPSVIPLNREDPTMVRYAFSRNFSNIEAAEDVVDEAIASNDTESLAGSRAENFINMNIHDDFANRYFPYAEYDEKMQDLLMERAELYEEVKDMLLSAGFKESYDNKIKNLKADNVATSLRSADKSLFGLAAIAGADWLYNELQIYSAVKQRTGSKDEIWNKFKEQYVNDTLPSEVRKWAEMKLHQKMMKARKIKNKDTQLFLGRTRDPNDFEFLKNRLAYGVYNGYRKGMIENFGPEDWVNYQSTKWLTIGFGVTGLTLLIVAKCMNLAKTNAIEDKFQVKKKHAFVHLPKEVKEKIKRIDALEKEIVERANTMYA